VGCRRFKMLAPLHASKNFGENCPHPPFRDGTTITPETAGPIIGKRLALDEVSRFWPDVSPCPWSERPAAGVTCSSVVIDSGQLTEPERLEEVIGPKTQTDRLRPGSPRAFPLLPRCSMPRARRTCGACRRSIFQS
jgi:hypothetical protein